MSKSGKLLELKEKNYSQVKKKQQKQNFTISNIKQNTLPNISKTVNRKSNMLQTKTDFSGVFQAKRMIAFKRSKEKSNQTKRSIPCSLTMTIIMLYTKITYTNIYESTNKRNV